MCSHTKCTNAPTENMGPICSPERFIRRHRQRHPFCSASSLARRLSPLWCGYIVGRFIRHILIAAYAALAVKNTLQITKKKEKRMRHRNADEKGRQAVALSLLCYYRPTHPHNTSKRFVCNKIEVIRPICRYCISFTSYTPFSTVHFFLVE